MLPPPGRVQLTVLITGLLLGGAALTGCGDEGSATSTTSGSSGTGSDNRLTVRVEPSAAPPGGTVGASVVNDGTREFTYGAGYELEREVDGSFEAVDLPDRPVIEIGYIAKPGKSGPPVQVQVPADAEPGTWRVVIQRDVAGVGDLTGEFQVTEPGG